MSGQASWKCARCGKENPSEARCCQNCQALKPRSSGCGAKRWRCVVCGFVFSGQAVCPVCASRNLAEISN